MTSPIPTLLLVEDNELDVEVVQRLLRRLAIDIPVVRARNGQEALERLRGVGLEPELAPPLIVLLDINMPRMNGFELLDEMSRDDSLRDLPVFVLSTSNNPADRNRAEGYGVCGYLVKPIRAEELTGTVLQRCPPATAPPGPAGGAPPN